MKTVCEVPIRKVPENLNIIYKVRENDDGSLKMKTRIALHGNKDKDSDILKTDSSQCTTLEYAYYYLCPP